MPSRAALKTVGLMRPPIVSLASTQGGGREEEDVSVDWGWFLKIQKRQV